MEPTGPRSALLARRDGVVFLLYCAVYYGYLFVHQESELEHWVSLVLIPFGILLLLGRSRSDGWVRGTLTEVGLVRGALTRGLSWAIPLGLNPRPFVHAFYDRIDHSPLRRLELYIPFSGVRL